MITQGHMEVTASKTVTIHIAYIGIHGLESKTQLCLRKSPSISTTALEPRAWGAQQPPLQLPG